MAMKSLTVLLFSCMALCGQDDEWTGEHRVFENRFYLSPWPETVEEGAQITRERVVDFISHTGNPAFKQDSDLRSSGLRR